jgi:hypothetical protein
MKKLLSILFLLPLFALASDTLNILGIALPRQAENYSGFSRIVNISLYHQREETIIKNELASKVNMDLARLYRMKTENDAQGISTYFEKGVGGYYWVTISLDGSSNPSLNGTTVTLSSGTYTGGTIQNLHDVTVNATAGTITGGMAFGGLTRVNLNNFSGNNISGSVVTWHGNNQVVREHNWNFWKTGNINDASYNQAYNGSVSTLNFYYFRLDSSSFRGCGYMLLGSFGAPGGSVAFMDSVQFDHLAIRNTSGNGINDRGDIWRLGWNYNSVIYDSTTNLGYGVDPVTGDVGGNYVYGSITEHDNYQRGGRGYNTRLWTVMLNNRYDTSKSYNNVHVCTWTYGVFNSAASDFDGSGTSTGTYTKFGGEWRIWNNTGGKLGDNIGYWCPMLVYGDMNNNATGPTIPVSLRNNLIVESVEQGDANYAGTVYSSNQYNKNKVLVDQSGGDDHPDTANNRHYIRAAGVIDTLTGAKLITINDGTGKGIGAVPGAAVNQAPAVDIQPLNSTVTLPTSSTVLNSSGSYDPDGTITSRIWSQLSGPTTALFSNNTAVSPTISNLTAAGTYVFQLVATDNSGASSAKNATVIVNAGNNAPVAQISPAGDQDIYQPASTIHLSGAGSTDDGTITVYKWTGTGPAMAVPTFSNSNTVQTDVSSLNAPGVYTVTLTVTDNLGATNAKTINITVHVAGTVDPTKLILRHGGKLIFK